MSPVRVEPAGPGCCLLSLLLLPLRIFFLPFVVRYSPRRRTYYGPRRWL